MGFFYRPLFSLWLLLFYTFVGPTPLLWHLASIALHGLATYFVFRLILRLLANELAASIGALVFAIHPIHIEAVSWVSAANELLYTICILAALLLIQESQAGSWDNKAWNALALWTAALLFKETAIVLLLLFVFLTWAGIESSADNGQRIKRTIRWAMPWVATAAIYLSLRMIVLHRSGLETGKQPWAQVLFSSPGLIVFYLKKLVLPLHLSSFYSEGLTATAGIGFWLAFLGVLVVFLAFFCAALKRRDWIALAGGIIILPLLPVLGGLRVYEHGNIAHDRYLYLPSAGLSLLVGSLAQKVSTKSPRWKLSLAGIGTAIVSASIYLSLSQQWWYADDQAYFRRAVEVYPQNFLVWQLWGKLNLGHKNLKEGLEETARAYKLAPENPNVDYHYAWALYENGRYSEAEPLLHDLADRTDQPRRRRKIVLLALAQAEMKQVQLAEAEKTLKVLLQMDDEFPGLHTALGNLYQLQGRPGLAEREFVRESEFLQGR